jgi:amino acid transporter
MLPVSGGYYRWVQLALGDFWGFQEGWWSWLFTFVDMALYTVLCADILYQSWPALTGGHLLSGASRMAFIFAFIWIAAIINWRGAAWVSRYSLVVMIGVLAPFLVLVYDGLHRSGAVVIGPTHLHTGTVGLALAVVVWNYTGWDNVGTFANEIERPARTYPLALLLTLAVITVAYLLPISAGLRLDPTTRHWTDGYFTHLGALAAGRWLAGTMVITATMSSWTQYTGQLVYVMELPTNLARDGFLPKFLVADNRFGVPVGALLFSSVLYSAFAVAPFSRLVIADTLLYVAGLVLEFVALVVFRKREPERERPFRVPLEGAALVAMCAIPLAVSAVTLYFAAYSEKQFLLLAFGMVATGPALYLLSRLWRQPEGSPALPNEQGISPATTESAEGFSN